MKIETTIGILSHDRSWHLAQCLASIRQFTRTPYTVKVLDVGSAENHREHISHFSGRDCEIGYCDDFLSCLEGRRRLLRLVDTEFVAFIDDDIKVAPGWLANLLRPMRLDSNCGAVASNLIQEGGAGISSGCRYLERKGRARVVRHHKTGFLGTAPMCSGGATLYRFDVLKETEKRPEFSGGFEDWDQTLQITQDLKRSIYGSRSVMFHRHLAECAGYFDRRWRWRELMEAALAMWDRWQIRTAVDNVLTHYLKDQIVIPKDYAERIVEVLI